VASAISARVRDWQSDRLGTWKGVNSSPADVWLGDLQLEAGSR
jgi:hypothetical protein